MCFPKILRAASAVVLANCLVGVSGSSWRPFPNPKRNVRVTPLQELSGLLDAETPVQLEDVYASAMASDLAWRARKSRRSLSLLQIGQEGIVVPSTQAPHAMAAAPEEETQYIRYIQLTKEQLGVLSLIANGSASLAPAGLRRFSRPSAMDISPMLRDLGLADNSTQDFQPLDNSSRFSNTSFPSETAEEAEGEDVASEDDSEDYASYASLMQLPTNSSAVEFVPPQGGNATMLETWNASQRLPSTDFAAQPRESSMGFQIGSVASLAGNETASQTRNGTPLLRTVDRRNVSALLTLADAIVESEHEDEVESGTQAFKSPTNRAAATGTTRLLRSIDRTMVLTEPQHQRSVIKPFKGAPPVAVLLGAAGAGVVFLGWIVSMERSSHRPRSDTSGEVRRWVESLPVQAGEEISHAVQPRGGYDCLLIQPQMVGMTVRLEGRINVAPQAVLRAPLARRSCVLFSASAGETRLDGVRAPPTAFYAMHSDFEIELSCRGAASVRVGVRGQDVALFDMTRGRQLEQWVLGDAPEHLQDFVRAHRAGPVGVAGALSGGTVLEFAECLLDADAVVTAIGELHRSPHGELQLWPLQRSQGSDLCTGGTEDSMSDGDPGDSMAAPGPSSSLPAPGTSGSLTSWERAGIVDSHVGKVMISDDPGLLTVEMRQMPKADTFCGTMGRTSIRTLSSPRDTRSSW